MCNNFIFTSGFMIITSNAKINTTFEIFVFTLQATLKFFNPLQIIKIALFFQIIDHSVIQPGSNSY